MTLLYSRTLHDVIHGDLGVTAEEMRVIDHPLFQRLRGIMQTGTLYLYTQSAVHTRFEHSIGVLAMAERLLNALELESRKISDKLYVPETASVAQAVRYYEVDPVLRDEIRRVTRIAALVHDLGHGPFSHAFDAFACSVESVQGLLADPRLRLLEGYRDAILASKSGRVSHEAVSCMLFAVLWNELCGEDWVVSCIASVLLAVPPVDVPEQLVPWVSFIRDIVSSAPIDADRMDYLLRDGRATGYARGYEADRLLKCVLCVRADTEVESYKIGWRYSGLPAIEEFVDLRYTFFKRFYTAKTSRAADLMLRRISEVALREGLTLIDADTLDGFVESYLDLSDDSFLRLLMGKGGRDFSRDEEIMALARQIRERRLWKRVFEFSESGMRELDPQVLLQELRQRYPNAEFILDSQTVKAMKDLDRGAYLLVPDRTSRYGARIESWLDASPRMQALAATDTEHVRIFLASSHVNHEEVKVEAREIAHQLRD